MEITKDDTVLVTGATGFTGSLLVKKLCAIGCNVRAIAPHSSDISSLKDLPIDWFRGDVYQKEVVQAAANGVQYIFHVAALFRSAKDLDNEYQLVHVDSTRLLAGVALNTPNFKRFIHVSTMGVHGHIDSPGHSSGPASVWWEHFSGEVGQIDPLFL
jgi:nucleoside-diphosphate-sugar epimerase